MKKINIDKLPIKKKNQVINAALLVFSQNGYKKTSMADVAKKAGVSKASIFYYFGNKESLYYYLSNFVFNEVVEKPAINETDFFKYLSLTIQAKLTLEKQHPGIFEFSRQMCSEENNSIVQLPDLKKKRIKKFLNLMTDNIDWTKFKNEVDPQKIINIVMWVAEGYVRDHPQQEDKNQIYQQLQAYFLQIKQLTYKQEYLN